MALAVDAYREVPDTAGIWGELHRRVSNFDHHVVALLAERAAAAPELVYEATANAHMRAEIAPAIARGKGSNAMIKDAVIYDLRRRGLRSEAFHAPLGFASVDDFARPRTQSEDETSFRQRRRSELPGGYSR